MSVIFYSLDKAYSVLDTRICLKIPILNHFDIRWIKNFNIKLELYNKDKEGFFNQRFIGNSYSVLGTCSEAKFEQVPSAYHHTFGLCPSLWSEGQ